MMQRVPGSRGFTLLEVMISAALGIVVVASGLAVGTQMQRRALFEEQTMMAQTTGRTLEEMLSSQVARAGAGMGNTPISFADSDDRFGIEMWSNPSTVAFFTTDGDYVAPDAAKQQPASDALRLYWGSTNALISLEGCTGKGSSVRQGADQFCLAPSSSDGLAPAVGQPFTLAVLANANEQSACATRVTNVNAGSNRLTATLGTGTLNTGGCGLAPTDMYWTSGDWLVMGLEGVAYRVNWKNNIPTLEALPSGATTWQVVSRDVEQLRVRQAVIDLTNLNAAPRWFPETDLTLANPPRPAISDCTVGQFSTSCAVETPSFENVPPTETVEVRRRRLQQRVREVEVTLVVRTRRNDREINQPTVTDDDGFRLDGYKRRTFTFRVAPRNFGVAGLVPPALTGVAP
ncbi:PilW family protein [Corallococcus aberystwythensis]|uniref:Pilus assembly protein n=1 Tax=Corallococcus aberystwythensis TaxID=2316722 RepID=A0A3A8PT41_9BACT|nr:prepilin-type N-terminal cleavage/methylation domain-containing protein [Corallococcus aberystwythensis]RKH59459.1 pilus assembly protein [Corallococcus aberystwythensis]